MSTCKWCDCELEFSKILPYMYGITDLVVSEILKQRTAGNLNDNVEPIPVV